MAKKTFNTQALANDLTQSAFFTPRPHQEPVNQPIPPDTAPKNPVTPQPSKPVTPQPRIQSPAELPTPRPALFKFDLEAKADQKYTTYFTEQEQELLDDLKIDVRRRYGHKTAKQDIIRCALADLVEDFQSHGADSRFIQRLKQQDHTKR